MRNELANRGYKVLIEKMRNENATIKKIENIFSDRGSFFQIAAINFNCRDLKNEWFDRGCRTRSRFTRDYTVPNINALRAKERANIYNYVIDKLVV